MKIIAILCTLGVLVAATSKRCDDWIASSEVFIRALSPVEPMTWREIDDECSHQYRGFQLLNSRHRSVGKPERTICGDTLVPLGVKMIDNTFYWNSRGKVELEKLSSDDLNYMLSPDGDGSTVGALNLTSGYWHLVPDNQLFECAICQMKRENELDDNNKAVNGKINQTKFDSIKTRLLKSNLNLKNEIKEMMISIKSRNITDITGFLKSNSSYMQNILKLYDNVTKSKVNLLSEGHFLLKRISDVPVPSSQLHEVTAISDDLISMNNDSLLRYDKYFYNQTIEIVKAVEVLNGLKSILKTDDNFLWSYKLLTHKIVLSMEKIALNLLLDSDDFVFNVARNTIVFVADVEGRGNPILGFSITDQKSKFSFDVLRHVMGKPLEQSSYTILFPPSTIHTGSRVAAVILVYKDSVFPKKILRDDSVGYLTPVVHLVFSDNTPLETAQQDLFVEIQFFNTEHSKNHKSISKYVTRECSFWNLEKGMWMTDGCQMINSSVGSLDICYCNHPFEEQCKSVLTGHFIMEDWNDYAAYLKHNKIPTKSRKNALGLISLIGYSFTVFGFLGIFITYIAFKTWNRELDNTALIHLCLAVILNISLLLVATFVRVPAAGVACIAVGAGLHYSLIACFTWIMNMSCLQLISLTNDLKSLHRVLIPCLLSFGWGVPLIPIVTLLSWNPSLYTSFQNNGSVLETGGPAYIAAVQALHNSMMTLVGVKEIYIQESINKEVCYPNGFALHVSEMVPVGCIIISNLIVIVLTICRIYCFKNETVTTEVYRKLISHLVLLLLFGVTWGFSGLAFININEVFVYVFAVVVTMIGLVLFILFVVLDEKSVICWGSLCRREKSYVINYNEPSTIPRYRGDVCRSFNRGNFYADDDVVDSSTLPVESSEMTSEPFQVDRQPFTRDMDHEY